MYHKKNKLSDFESTRASNFFVGLLTMVGMCLAAFTYSNESMITSEKSKVKPIDIEYLVADEKPIELPKIKLPEEEKEPQKQQEATVNIQRTIDEKISVSTNTKDEIKTEVTLGGINLKFGATTPIDEIIADIDPENIEITDIDAKYNGGFPRMSQFIQKNLIYPQDAIEMNMQGVVYVSFVVEKNGDISNVSSENKVFPSLNKEAERIVKTFPVWIPGEVKMKKVRSRVILPIRFELN